MNALRAIAVVPAAALLLLAGAGCSNNNDPSGSASSMPTTGDVNSVEKDFSIALDTSTATTASAGALSFAVHNEGPAVHEFVVFKTDLAEDALPTSDDGTVDEEGEGVQHVDEIEDIAAGSTTSLDVNLDAGKYVLICNLPGHYAQGMHASLTIG